MLFLRIGTFTVNIAFTEEQTALSNIFLVTILLLLRSKVQKKPHVEYVENLSDVGVVRTDGRLATHPFGQRRAKGPD